eukprot:scaffold988_cov393-Pavlova_lutheri.AAC.10
MRWPSGHPKRAFGLVLNLPHRPAPPPAPPPCHVASTWSPPDRPLTRGRARRHTKPALPLFSRAHVRHVRVATSAPTRAEVAAGHAARVRAAPPARCARDRPHEPRKRAGKEGEATWLTERGGKRVGSAHRTPKPRVGEDQGRGVRHHGAHGVGARRLRHVPRFHHVGGNLKKGDPGAVGTRPWRLANTTPTSVDATRTCEPPFGGEGSYGEGGAPECNDPAAKALKRRGRRTKRATTHAGTRPSNTANCARGPPKETAAITRRCTGERKRQVQQSPENERVKWRESPANAQEAHILSGPGRIEPMDNEADHSSKSMLPISFIPQKRDSRSNALHPAFAGLHRARPRASHEHGDCWENDHRPKVSAVAGNRSRGRRNFPFSSWARLYVPTSPKHCPWSKGWKVSRHHPSPPLERAGLDVERRREGMNGSSCFGRTDSCRKRRSSSRQPGASNLLAYENHSGKDKCCQGLKVMRCITKDEGRGPESAGVVGKDPAHGGEPQDWAVRLSRRIQRDLPLAFSMLGVFAKPVEPGKDEGRSVPTI